MDIILFKKIQSNSAFTIIEVMVAIAIISIGMLGVVSLMSQNIQVQVVNKNNLIASMLAQEGIELVRGIRDENWLDQANPVFHDGLGEKFAIDAVNKVPDATTLSIDGQGASLFIKDGFYQHDNTGIQTIFSRLLEVTPDSDTPPKYITVKSTVRWKSGDRSSDYIAETTLYDWR